MTANWISRRWLQILLLSAGLAFTSARFSQSSEDDVPVDADEAESPLIINNNNADLLRIKKAIALGLDPDRGRHEEILSWKIEDIDLVCRLTAGQKEKLRLAGQGDIQRFLDRAHQLRDTLQTVNEPPQIENVIREWDSLNKLMKSGIFEEGSLFFRTWRQILTAEQIVRLEASRVETSPAWMKDFDEAHALALTLDRPVLIHFGAKWCAPSKKIERVMMSPAVLRVLRRKFVLVSIDVDQHAALAQKYKINSLPCELVVTTAGDILCRSEGLKDEREFLHALHFVKNEPGKKPEAAPP